MTIAALGVPREAIATRTPCPVTVHADSAALTRTMADCLLQDIRDTLAVQDRCTLIVPVGPVGQYPLLAGRCVAEGQSLDRVTVIVMDEYLTSENRWIEPDDPLSFRGHMQRQLLGQMPEAMRPELVVPDPLALGAIPDLVARQGVDVCHAGVGITGHLAFNDPVPGRDDPHWFATLPTRIVPLAPETRLINAVTAALGNTLRIPHLAVTVGMHEILGAARLRIWMNRPWQCAALRRMLFGPVTGAFPASLVQRHGSLSVHVTEEVLALPEPGLR